MDFVNAITTLRISRMRGSQVKLDSVRLWLFVAIGLAVMACQSPEERCLDTVREAVYAGDFAKGLAAADRFYEKHAVEAEHPSEEAMALRWEISAYTRLCLLMTNNLNRRFLAYYPVQEMGVLFPSPLPFVNRHCYAYARLYYEMGLYGPALPIVLWQAEDEGWNKAGVDLLFGIYTKTHQYRAAQTYLRTLEHDADTRAWCRDWHERVTAGAGEANAGRARHDTVDGTRTRPLTDEWLTGPRVDEGFIDGYVKAFFRYNMTQATKAQDDGQGGVISDESPVRNPYLTDYYTLLCLLEKDLGQVPALLDIYRRQRRPLPDYLQEAALIYTSDAQKAETLEAAGLTREALALSPAMEQRVAKVFQDFAMLKAGALPFDVMTRRHAATYTYHFLFGQIQ